MVKELGPVSMGCVLHTAVVYETKYISLVCAWTQRIDGAPGRCRPARGNISTRVARRTKPALKGQCHKNQNTAIIGH